MRSGDIIDKILGLFGVAPKTQRQLLKRIAATTRKIAEMEEERNGIMRTNTAIGEKIADLKRQLQVETNPHNQDLLMDQIDELEKEFGRKQALAQQMTENISAQRAIRAKLEQLLEQARHGADPVEIEMLMERVEDMVTQQDEAVKAADKLDNTGRKARGGKATAKDDAARAARRAAMLGTAAPATPAATVSAAPAAPATPAPAAPASPAPASDGRAASPLAAEAPAVG